MDIANMVSTEFETHDGEDRISKVAGTFDDSSVKGVVVTDDGDLVGVITRRQLSSSHRPPNAKARSFVTNVPTVSKTADVREVAGLMVASDSMVLPVVSGDDLVGVVSGDDVLRGVKSSLVVLDVADVVTDDPITVGPDATVGAALNLLRENRITHLPVVDGTDPVGMVGLADLIGYTTREVRRSSGGDAGGVDSQGGTISAASGRAHGGFGAREGEVERVLDLPVRDVMSEPVLTVDADRSLDEAVARMFDHEVSSLVVLADGDPTGIVTKTDALRSLTWGAESTRAVQINGTDLMDDLSYDAVLAMVEDLDHKYADMSILDVRIHLHEHDEQLRGTPLLLARVRLYTDRGFFLGEGEGYGARHAVSLAMNVLERKVLEGKTYGRSKKHPDPGLYERLYGWYLSG